MITASAARTVSVLRIQPLPRLDPGEALSRAHRARAILPHACDADLLQIAEGPGMRSVHRAEPTERTRRVCLVRGAPRERDRRLPPRVAPVAEAPARRE